MAGILIRPPGIKRHALQIVHGGFLSLRKRENIWGGMLFRQCLPDNQEECEFFIPAGRLPPRRPLAGYLIESTAPPHPSRGAESDPGPKAEPARECGDRPPPRPAPAATAGGTLIL